MNYTIRQMAEMFGVSAHTLRFYTDKGLLPCKRDGGNEHIVLIGRHRRDRSPSSQSPAAIHIPPTAPRIYHRMCFSSVFIFFSSHCF